MTRRNGRGGEQDPNFLESETHQEAPMTKPPERPLLALRSTLWAIMPGIVAGYVPWLLGLNAAQVDLNSTISLLALLVIAAGLVLLVACIVEFARSGRGTLSPADPPRQLVARGLYRYVRNPMYVSVAVILLAEALLARSTAIAAYWAFWFLLVNVFVIAYEEPTLRRTFGPSYEAYCRHVGRWLPTFRSQTQEP